MCTFDTKKDAMQNRAIVEHMQPQPEGGAYPIKRVVKDWVTVTADVFGDGHDEVNAVILYRFGKQKKWKEAPMRALGNDAWQGAFQVEEEGMAYFTVLAWVDHPLDWYLGIGKKIAAGVEVEVELQMGADWLDALSKKAKGPAAKAMTEAAEVFRNANRRAEAIELAVSSELLHWIHAYPLRENPTQHEPMQAVRVEDAKASFSSWYEFFPRSAAKHPGQHGTFKDCARALSFVKEMGFDVLYFPPIHPIGTQHRKGKNNSTEAQSGEPGSPWAIGSSLGGHKAVHPELGTEADFLNLVEKAKSMEIDVAMDIAFQASQDHPYVKEHPEWFKWRPDGTVQYAENPPKKYQDVLPFHFETHAWKSLWEELKSIVLYWADRGIRIFRVDNPHTKPFVFWEWLIAEVQRKHPRTIFLSEAFTRPKIMARLARIGFTQSYTYFTWRNHKQEIIQYMEELTKSELREYFRPNFWPNTPDILPYNLQNQGQAACAIRIALAATLSSNYGMYGPVYDLLETKPYPGKEEYWDSEKYEIRVWDWETQTPFRRFIKGLNCIRKTQPALQDTYNITFCETDQEMLLAYYKQTGESRVLVVMNLDPHYMQSGHVRLPYGAFNFEGRSVEVKDLITEEMYRWGGEWNYVELNPERYPCHIFSLHPIS